MIGAGRADPGVAAIQLKVQRVDQLFQTLDPFPFRHRDLDADVEEFIVGWAREADRRTPLAIRIQLPADQTQGEDAAQVEAAFHNYFLSREAALELERRALFRTGRLSLAIGLTVLALCMILGQAISGLVPDGFLQRFLEEGIIIVGWVANWRPIEIFLFEWWPIARKRRLYRRLAVAPVTFDVGRPAA